VASKEAQARWRATHTTRATVQARLDPATVARLDRLASKRGAAGRGQIIDWLVQGAAPDPLWLAGEGLRLLRAYFDQTGETRVYTSTGAWIDLEAFDRRPRPK
jgi:hypothetical protein